MLFAMDDNNQRIRRIDLASGVVSTVAGGGATGCADGPGRDASFNAVGLSVGLDGQIYVADYLNHRIRVITLNATQRSQ